MKQIRRIIVIASIFTVASVVLWHKAAEAVKNGLAESRKLRPVEANRCVVGGTQSPHFAGCNSIL